MTFKEGWDNFFKHPVVKGVKKTLAILLRCIVTILLVCVITVSIVGCVVAVYVVFNDAALREMSIKKPCTEQAFMQISGVGERKNDRYGKAFLAEIQAHMNGK